MTSEPQQTDALEQVDEQTHITELSIAPDGRVYVFGMSRQILEVLETIGPSDEHLRLLIQQVRSGDACVASPALKEATQASQLRRGRTS